MLKFFTRNYWYDVILRSTYFKTLQGKSLFTVDEIALTKREFHELVRSNRHMVKDVYSEFHLSWSSAILATYRACLNKGLNEEASIEFSAMVIFENMQADAITTRVRHTLDKAKDPFHEMVKGSKYQEKYLFGNTFEFTRPIDNDNHYHLIVHKCFYNDFFRHNGAPELMKIACKWDFISWSKGIEPEKHLISFSRPVTLGLDNKDCQFTFDRLKLKA